MSGFSNRQERHIQAESEQVNPNPVNRRDSEQYSSGLQALKVAGIYFLVGCAWIIMSDKIAEALFPSIEVLTVVNIIKGWFYVFATAALLFFLIRYEIQRIIDSKESIRKINSSLEQSNTLFSAILESSPDMIFFSLDTQYRYTAFNLRHKENARFIWSGEVDVGINYIDQIQSTEKREEMKRICDRALSGEYLNYIEETGRDKESMLFWQIYVSPIMNAKKECVGITFFTMNITALKRAQEKNQYLSYHDTLTNLYNRRYYEEALHKMELDKVLPISVIIGDLNGLKMINDAFGHSVGDELIVSAADAFRSVCRKEDIVARWGGDEFIILLPGIDQNEVEQTVSAIKKECSSRDVRSIPVDISFGWHTRSDESEDMTLVLKNAEDYMFKNKIIESRSMRSHTIRVIMNTLHEKNPREEAHSNRVGDLCKKMGEAMNLSEQDVKTLHMIGFLHDIGKIAMDEGILNKKGKLTDEEYEQIKLHPEIGCRIIRSSYEITEVSESILSHHERWNGSGYPKGLSGEQIPMYARIIAIADSFDAMTSMRTFRACVSGKDAAEEILRCAGSMYDPKIAELFYRKVFPTLELSSSTPDL